jgi:sugar lactone lactonase YvrE
MRIEPAGVEVLPVPDVVIRGGAEVGEGPVVDPRTGRLCWVDITGGVLYENDLETGAQSVSRMSTMLGAAAPRAHTGGFAVAVSEGFGFWADGELRVVDPVLPDPNRRMNDAKCDSRGRLWAGSTHLDFEPGVGALHCWDGHSPSTVVADGFILPNGIGWSPDDRTMYLVDSLAHAVLAAPFDPDTGEVGAFAPICTIGPGLPDGLAVDVEGFLWVAVWDGSEVRRISPTGEVAAIVPMPVTQPSSCAFGDDGILYITSASAGLSDDELAAQPPAGSVFALPTDTHGVPVHSFEG